MFGAAKDGHSAMTPIFRMRLRWMDGMEDPQLLVVGIASGDGPPPDSCYTPFCQPLPYYAGFYLAQQVTVAKRRNCVEMYRILLNCLASGCASFQFKGNIHVKAFEGFSSGAAQCLQ